MAAQMRAHKAELKGIQSHKSKAELKAKILPDYYAYVDGVIDAENAVQDDTVMTAMIWGIDAGEYDFAINIAEWAIENGLDTPPEFTRNVQTLLTETLAGVALVDRGNIDEFAVALLEVSEIVAEADMPDQVRAKLFKALSWANAESDPAVALSQAQQALEFDEKVGVKTDIRKLEKTIADAAETNK